MTAPRAAIEFVAGSIEGGSSRDGQEGQRGGGKRLGGGEREREELEVASVESGSSVSEEEGGGVYGVGRRYR